MIINRIMLGLTLSLMVISQSVVADFGMNRQITKNISQSISKNLFERIAPRLKIKNSSGKVNQMQVSNTGKYLTLSFEDDSIRVWDLEYGVQRPTVNNTKALANEVDEKNGVFYILTESGITGHEILTAKKNNELSLSQTDKASSFSLSNSGNNILLINNEGMDLFDIKTKNKIWSQNQFEGDLKKVITEDKLGWWASLLRKESLFSSNDWIEIGDLKTGDKKYKLENDGSRVVFFGLTGSPNQLRVGYESGKVITWNTATGKKTSEVTLDDTDIVLMDIFVDGTIAYIGDSDQLVVTDMQQKNRKNINVRDKDILQVALLNNGKTLATADEKGQVLFWNVLSGGQFLQLIATTEGWTVVDNIGRFDSSEKGVGNVSWEVKDSEIPLDSFSKNYYEPGVLATHLNNNKFINSNATNVREGITGSPFANIIEPTLNSRQSSGKDPIKLHVVGYGMGGGLEEIHLYHNGKKNQKGSIATKKTKGEKGMTQEMDFNVVLSVGKNTFRAVVINSMGVEGESKEFVVNVEGEQTLPIIHVVSVGINEYSDPRLNLDYSVSDADIISKTISEKNLAKYGKVERQGIYDRQATKENILNYLGGLKQYSQDDVLVVYAAGHGIAIDKKWYFLPYETTLKDEIHEYEKIGISAKEFREVLVKNKAQKVFVIIDSCFSEAGIAAFRDLQNTQRHFSRDLSRSVGVVVLTAARYDQEAAELSDLGHGLFTYVVTQGMDGQADIQPINKKISAHEIAEFAVDTIPVFSKKYLGASQEPAAFVIGEDFELLRKTN